MISVQPNQLWEFHPVFDQAHSNWSCLFAEEPATVGFPKSVLLGRVGVQVRVRMRVVVTMVSGPPDGATLDCGRAQKPHEKLNRAACAKRFVAEVAVVKAGDCEHADDVHPQAQGQRCPGESHPENRNTRHMQKDVGNRFHPPDAPFGDVWFMVRFFNEMISHRTVC